MVISHCDLGLSLSSPKYPITYMYKCYRIPFHLEKYTQRIYALNLFIVAFKGLFHTVYKLAVKNFLQKFKSCKEGPVWRRRKARKTTLHSLRDTFLQLFWCSLPCLSFSPCLVAG